MTVQSQHNSAAKSNFRHLVHDMVWYSAGIAATSRFLAVYAIRAGASPIDLGWISSLPALIVLITASFGGWWSRRYPNAARSIYWPALGQRFAFLLPALTPLLPLRWQPLWLILSISIPAIPQGVAAVPFMVMMREAIDPARMPRLLALRQIAANGCVAIAAVIFGFWLETAPYPLNYVVMFLVSFVLSLISLYYCTSIKELTPTGEAAFNAAPVVKQTQANPWRERGFQKIAFVTVTIHVAFFVIVPLVPLLLVSRLGADEGYMAIYALVELTAGTVGSILGPYVERKIGARPMIALCIAFTALNGIIIALAPNLTVALLAPIFSGAFWTMGAGVSLYNF
ncbi:MAG TPA: MFS transporter, partial [Phototrophicaceae bacterium]|nr:MFS transporter [Phototrophicaceae bacterium]